MNHLRDRVPHMADGLCQYAHQYNNKVLICKVRLTPDTSLAASLGELKSSSRCDDFCVVSAFVLLHFLLCLASLPLF